MKKTFYIIFVLITGCLNYQGPFQDEKSSLLISEHRIFGIYVSDIIGLNESDNIELRILIAKKLKNKDLLASNKKINKKSFVLKGTAVSFKTSNKFIILWKFNKLGSQKSISYQSEISLLNKSFKLNLEEISQDISDKIYQYFNQPVKKKILLVRNIDIFHNHKNKTVVFIDTLVTKIKLKKINIELKTNKDNISVDKDTRVLDIKIEKFLLEDEEKINVEWIVSTIEGKELGSIKQTKNIKKGLIDKIWTQIAAKIIDMAILELNYLSWVD